MEDLKSSIPGLVNFSTRVERFPTGYSWLEGRRKLDGAEGLWRINNQLYDLHKFIKNHPGGSEWITMTKGTDITELFVSHHITNKAEKLLPKYYVREATAPRSIPFTFHPDGFYQKFKKRCYDALKEVDFHRPSLKTNLFIDSLLITTLVLSLIAAVSKSLFIILLAGSAMTCTVVAAHNYFHMRDNFRMYYWDICGMSSRRWRITHAMSHHMYPNTIWDFEVYSFEPFLQYLPKVKAPIRRAISWIYAPIIWLATFWQQGIERYLTILFKSHQVEFRDLVPFFIPTLMYFVSGNLYESLQLWIMIIGVSSFTFSFIGLTAAHHHPKIFHDGDIARSDLDWGLLEMDAVRDREIVDDSFILVLTQFGLHSLHHLLPTVDHSYLVLCLPALEETCREFGVNLARFTPWELMRGQFEQLRRVETAKNH